MKRFILCAGPIYYPGGGMSDFEGDFETLNEALARANEIMAENGWGWWWQVYDTTERAIVERGQER